MKFKIKLTGMNPETEKRFTEEILILEKQNGGLEDIGLSLDESKNILKPLQKRIVGFQTAAFINAKKNCEHCWKKHRKKGSYSMLLR